MKLLGAFTVAVAISAILTGCAGRYSTYTEVAFLNSCEVRGTASYCSCTLNFLEATVSTTQLEADENEYARTGVLPAMEQTAASVCRVTS